MRSITLPLLLTLLAGAVLGCGDGSSSPTPDAGPPPVDQCINPSDLAILDSVAAMADGGIPDGGVPDGGPYPISYNTELSLLIANLCGGPGTICFENVLTETGLEECLTTCLASTPAAGISIECASCYVDIVPCGTEHCITQCAVDVHSAACDECFNEYCAPRVEECTGLPLLEAP